PALRRRLTRPESAQAVDGAHDRLERRGGDRLVHADTPGDALVAPGLDVGDGSGVGAGADGVLGVVDDLDVDAEVGLEGVHERRDRAVALPGYRPVLVLDEELGRDARPLARRRGLLVG